jgi:glycosyltransferase involved in cell wall biosynthesis
VTEYRRTNEEIDKFSALAMAGLPFRMVWASDAYRDLRRLIQQHKPDVAHVHNTLLLASPAVYSACHAEGVPVVQSLHNARLICPGAWLCRDDVTCRDCVGKAFAWPGVLHGCWRGSSMATAAVALTTTGHRLAGTWRNKVNAYIVFSQFFRDEFVRGGLPADKIHVKPHFIDPDPGARTGLGEDYALFVGRIEAVKGVMTMLEAWRKVDGIPLKIIGDGELRAKASEVIQTITPAGAVELIGQQERPEVMERMKRARFLVWPSEGAETFGLVAAEAFACGVPVITTRFGAMAELVEDGKTGLHFSLGDASDLAVKVRWAIEHPSEMGRMGENARKVYEQKYTAETNYRQLIAIYRHAIAESTIA